MADDITIPVNSDPDRSINMVLDGSAYILSTRWNFTDNAWYLDIESAELGMLVRGIKLLLGIELLKPYAITELGQLYVIDGQGMLEDPTEESLGDRHQLLYILKENVGTFI